MMTDFLFKNADDATVISSGIVRDAKIQERVKNSLEGFDGTVTVEAAGEDKIHVYAQRDGQATHRTRIDAYWLLAQNFDGFEALIKGRFLGELVQ